MSTEVIEKVTPLLKQDLKCSLQDTKIIVSYEQSKICVRQINVFVQLIKQSRLEDTAVLVNY